MGLRIIPSASLLQCFTFATSNLTLIPINLSGLFGTSWVLGLPGVLKSFKDAKYLGI